MDNQTASILATLLDYATEGNWPNVASRMVEAGYTPDEVCAAAKVVTDAAGMSELFDPADF